MENLVEWCVGGLGRLASSSVLKRTWKSILELDLASWRRRSMSYFGTLRGGDPVLDRCGCSVDVRGQKSVEKEIVEHSSPDRSTLQHQQRSLRSQRIMLVSSYKAATPENSDLRFLSTRFRLSPG